MRPLSAIILAVLLPLFSATAQNAPGCATCSTAGPQAGIDGAVYLARLNAIAGWARGRTQAGVIASGTMARLDDQSAELSTIPVTLEIRADHKFRMELGSGDLLVVNDAVASRKLGNGTAALILPHVALSQVAPYFPFFSDLSATNDPDVQIRDSSRATINGDSAIGILVDRKFPAAASFKPTREKSSALRMWISETTGLPVKVDFVRLATDNQNVPITYSLYYSTWRQIDGVLVPTQIDEGIKSRVFLRYRFSSVAFSSQIPDSDFSAGGANR